jgi:CheY-like chemotaxis protein
LPPVNGDTLPFGEDIFMSEDQRDAIVGRLVREREESEAQLSLLTTEAERFGRTLEELGKRLQIEPEFVVFDRQETSIRYSSVNLERPIYQASDINGEQVRTLTHGIRTAMDRINDLQEEVRKLVSFTRNKTILVIDDDADIRLGYQVLLKAHHYDTFFAPDALSAEIEARTHKPDLVILDLGLPGDDGFVVMERLRANMHLAVIPIIVVSGRDPYVNRGRALKGGAMAFVQKPWDDVKLLTIIDELLGSREPSISQLT